VTDVPSIEGSGASPFKGARYSDESDSELELDGREEIGLESSAANDISWCSCLFWLVSCSTEPSKRVERGKREERENNFFPSLSLISSSTCLGPQHAITMSSRSVRSAIPKYRSATASRLPPAKLPLFRSVVGHPPSPYAVQSSNTAKEQASKGKGKGKVSSCSSYELLKCKERSIGVSSIELPWGR